MFTKPTFPSPVAVRSIIHSGLSGILLTFFLSGCSLLEAPFQFLGMRQRPLYAVSSSSVPEDLFEDRALLSERASLIEATNESLRYLESGKGIPPRDGVKIFTEERLIRSLKRFRELLLSTSELDTFKNALRDEFLLFRSIGRSTTRDVLFTAYCEPEVLASRTPSPQFQYPLFGTPDGFSSWPKPHPTRSVLEGSDGRGGLLRGKELFFLRDRFDALFIQIQGSSLLRLPNGELRRVGFAAATEHPFKSIVAALIKDGHLSKEEADANSLRRFFREHPELLEQYAGVNNRVVMFRELPLQKTATGELRGPIGSLGRPLVAGRSLAADRTIFPAGGLAIVRGDLPFDRHGRSGTQSRLYLDQDTGSAIKGPGRIDLFLGSGAEACSRAGTVKTPGELYYLLLKD